MDNEPASGSETPDPAPSSPQRKKLGAGWITLIVLDYLAYMTVPFWYALARHWELTTSPHATIKHMMKDLEMAIKTYQTEFSHLPVPLRERAEERQFVESKGRLFSIIMAEDAELNPRNVRFYDPPAPQKNGPSGGVRNEKGELELRDQWGNFLRIHFDWNGDGRIPDPVHPGESVEAITVIIYSAGPDGDYDTWADNLASWQ